ncbi:MAG: 1-acyl-sn-glycerol-3-phosphate acyltransferase [Chroococcus sp. CMT-3BRIN-NPC107]|nr:1-acyl-sn-glycerol-3-phosphate acyltransferase [Chroococcus sp. CMT-3BRIN-NPC107]
MEPKSLNPSKTSTSQEVALSTPISSRVSPWLAPLAYFLGCRIVLPLHFGKITTSGQENLPTNGPVILAPTHRSRWDAVVVPAVTGRTITGRDLTFMVSENEASGLQGWFVRRLGGFPVNTDRPSIRTLRYGVEVLLQQEMLVIFPEGNIFRDGSVHPLKPGLARLAVSAETTHPGLGVQVVPIGLKYSQSYPQWGCDVSIYIGSPLKVADYNLGSVKQSAKKLTSDLETALKTLI